VRASASARFSESDRLDDAFERLLERGGILFGNDRQIIEQTAVGSVSITISSTLDTAHDAVDGVLVFASRLCAERW
jgi:hypothetical protein